MGINTVKFISNNDTDTYTDTDTDTDTDTVIVTRILQSIANSILKYFREMYLKYFCPTYRGMYLKYFEKNTFRTKKHKRAIASTSLIKMNNIV